MTVHTSPSAAAPAVLSFWFDEVGQAKWFAKDAALDAEIARRFSGLRGALLASGAKGWRDDPDTLLAAIILLDQFSRNIYRDSAKAFEADPLALELAGEGLDRGWVQTAAPDRRQFYLMPLMHSERIADQNRSLAEFARLSPANLNFAHRHHDQIERFGRFPGRNQALGRISTAAESEALRDGAAF